MRQTSCVRHHASDTIGRRHGSTLDFHNSWLYRYFVLPLWIIATILGSVLATILGAVSIRQIQASLGARCELSWQA
jgi:hypothetical protein